MKQNEAEIQLYIYKDEVMKSHDLIQTVLTVANNQQFPIILKNVCDVSVRRKM